jgi:hypothetical protein
MKYPLFNYLDLDRYPIQIVKTYFDCRNEIYFVEHLNYIVNRKGVGNEYSGCMFPEEVNEVDDESFSEGILCWFLEEEVIISEKEFYDVMVMACQRYIELNPRKKDEIYEILKKWQFTNDKDWGMPSQSTQ